MYNSDHTAPECIGQKKIFLLPPQSVDVLSRFIYTALWINPTSLNPALDIANIIYFFTNQAILMWRSTVLSLPLLWSSLVIS